MRRQRSLGTRSWLSGLLSLAFYVVSACGAEPDEKAQALIAQSAPVLTKPANPRFSVGNEILQSKVDSAGEMEAENLRYFPLSKYRKYPEEVRALIRGAEIENDQCRGRFDSETYRACNRRERLMIELENRGWCWGGADVGYLEHWLKCADDPYLPRSYRRIPHFYPEEEIDRAEDPAKTR